MLSRSFQVESAGFRVARRLKALVHPIYLAPSLTAGSTIDIESVKSVVCPAKSNAYQPIDY